MRDDNEDEYMSEGEDAEDAVDVVRLCMHSKHL